ncbi:hypothetical protein MIMGU_mgv1a017821mg [Erythranthe guttata]|uniref:non-specific serine/threonine protein kinase n=1 Tax=Erythranthe guttata TaxID=4155 RepID=A0A022Q8G9_ERYGU|nr:hypothetical protein MIMGU_mgv1a017821mg [Erythranthe guttata]
MSRKYVYIALEYAYTAKVTEKSDVYSFGVVLLELLTGIKRNDPLFWSKLKYCKVGNKKISLLSTTQGSVDYKEIEEVDCLDQLIDNRMNKEIIEDEELHNVMNVAMLCTTDSPTCRPSVTRVLEFLELFNFIEIGHLNQQTES